MTHSKEQPLSLLRLIDILSSLPCHKYEILFETDSLGFIHSSVAMQEQRTSQVIETGLISSHIGIIKNYASLKYPAVISLNATGLVPKLSHIMHSQKPQHEHKSPALHFPYAPLYRPISAPPHSSYTARGPRDHIL